METLDRAGATDLDPINQGTPSAPPLDPIADRPLPLPPGTQTEAAPRNPEPALHVAFVGVTRKGKQRHGRAFLNGIFDLATPHEVNRAEELIAESRGLESVEILPGWQLLRS